MTVRLTVTTDSSEQVFFYELAGDDALSTLCLLLESECGMAAADQVSRAASFQVFASFLSLQVLVHNGNVVQGATLAQAGLAGDVQLVLLRKLDLQQHPRNPPPPRPVAAPEQDPATLMEVIRNDPTTIEELSRANPELLEAALSNNLARFKELLEAQHLRSQEGELDRREEEYQRLLASADPFDPVAQGKIAEYIRQKNVEGNYVNAMEHNPEAFASVSMLYIACKVNGVAMKAFVDSGAQSTIMSEKCAQACNILHLLDTRFAGVARGVGEAKILVRFCFLLCSAHFCRVAFTWRI
jgi:DNA damage-inducible protein 1